VVGEEFFYRVGVKTYLRHRVKESTGDTLFVRKREFGNEKCTSRENKVGTHDRSDRSHESVSPIRRRWNDDGEKETRNSG